MMMTATMSHIQANTVNRLDDLDTCVGIERFNGAWDARGLHLQE